MQSPNTNKQKAIIIATGPSLNADQIEWALEKQEEGWLLFGMNNVFQRVPQIDVLMSCNVEWWQTYYEQVKSLPCDKWTWDLDTANRYGLRYIEGRWADSLSKDARYLHYGHSSGYQTLGIAYNYGMREMYLLGYDMAYPPGEPRHFFGEYPKHLYHNPRTGPNGEFTGLIENFKTIDEADLGLKVINLCPTSALDHFEKGTIYDY